MPPARTTTMSLPNRSTPTLPPELARRLDPVCARFTAEWQAGRRPRLEDFLAQVQEADRPTLLRELLAVDLEHRTRHGERPGSDDYCQRLPDYADLIENAFLVPTGPDVAADPSLGATPGGARGALTDSGSDGTDCGQGDSVGSGSVWRAGRYLIEGRIAKGGMGAVWRARDPELNRVVAVKAIREEYRGNPDLERRFREEAHITGQLQHPGIPPVHELGILPDGRPFFAMKLVRGQTLAVLLASRSSPSEAVDRFLRYFEQIAEALAYAHNHDIIHRDLKPLNVMVGAHGELQVMDWGVAKKLRHDRPATPDAPATKPEDTVINPPQREEGQETKGALGTFAYMAPEQARGRVRVQDARCDVFSMGAVLCEILTGTPPYTGASRDEIREQAEDAALEDAYRRLDQSGAHPVLVLLARRCLAKEREDRPANAGEVWQAITAYRLGEQEHRRQLELRAAQESARADAEKRRADAEKRRADAERRARWRALGMVTAGLLLVGALVAGWWWLKSRQAQAEEAVAQALHEREELRARAFAAPVPELERLFEDAQRAAARAVKLAQGGFVSAAVRERAEHVLAAAERDVKEMHRDQELLTRLLDVSQPRETAAYRLNEKGNPERLVHRTEEEQFAEAFRAWGLDVDQAPERDALARFRDRPEAVLQELLAGLDTWMLLRWRQKGSAERWQRLLRLAGKLDRSELRRQLRTVLTGGPPPRDRIVAGLTAMTLPWSRLCALARGGNWRRLLELRAQVDTRKESVLTVLLLAQVCLRLGDPTGTEEVLREALVARPNEVVLLHNLGRQLERRRPPRLAEAIECYKAVRAVRPSLGVALGLVLPRAGRGAEGEAILRELIHRQPKNPELYFCLGNALSTEGKLPEAVAAYRQALRLQPNYPEALNNLGNALDRQGDLPGAFSAIKEALRLKSDLYEAQTSLGNVLRQQRKLGAAVAALEKVVRRRPDSPEAHLNLGLALRDQGKLDRAEAAFRAALRLAPDLSSGYNNLGIVLAEQRKLPEAVAAFKEAIRLEPDSDVMLANLGRALGDQGSWDEALAIWRQVLRRQPDLIETRYQVGATLCDRKRDYPGAAAAFREVLSRRPGHVNAHVGLGNVLLYTGKLDQAADQYREAVRLKPDAVEAHFGLGRVLAGQGKLAEAEAAYRAAIRAKPNFPAAYNELAVPLRGQGRLAEALAAYQEAVRLRPDYAEAHCNVGFVLRDLGRFREALASFQQGQHFGATRPGWPSDRTAAHIRHLEHLVKLDEQLAEFLTNKRTPSSAAERLELAALCRYPTKRLYAASARFYQGAFAADATLADNLSASHRYNAARSAALAGCGRGADKPRPDVRESARLRQLALAWLRDDLAAWAAKVQAGKSQMAAQALGYWQRDPDLACVRGADALRGLAEEEREAWSKLWADVAVLRQRAESK
jgi:serine/threonine-protein kinase